MAELRRRGRGHGQIAKLAFSIVALAALGAEAVLFHIGEQYGFDQETAEIVALALLIAGLASYLVFHHWGGRNWDGPFERRW